MSPENTPLCWGGGSGLDLYSLYCIEYFLPKSHLPHFLFWEKLKPEIEINYVTFLYQDLQKGQLFLLIKTKKFLKNYLWLIKSLSYFLCFIFKTFVEISKYKF